MDEIARLQEMVAAAPGDPGRRDRLGFALLERRDHRSARAVFLAMLRQDRDNFAARLGVAKAAREAGDRRAALAHARLALAIAPGELGVEIDIAFDLLELEQDEAAGAALQALLRPSVEASVRVAALVGLGRAELRRGDADAAEMRFATALTLDPDHVGAMVACAETRKALGDPQGCRALLDRVLEVAPDSLEALLGLSELHAMAQDHAGCLALSLRAAEAHLDHVAPVLQATRALMALGRTAEALALLEPWSAGRSDDICARKAEILQAAGEWDAAAAALANDHAAFGPWLQRVRLHLALGLYAATEALLAAAPVRSTAERGLAGLFRGQLAEARWQLDVAGCLYRVALTTPGADGAFRPWAHAELARVSLLLCDLDACCDHMRKSLLSDAAVHRLRGQSANPASTHVGQILDEFRMDPDRTHRLRRLLQIPAQARITPLLALQREVPHHTPTAMQLGIALRQAGLLKATPPGGPGRIPQQIVQYWDEPEAPPEIAAMMLGWAAMNPGHAHRRFDLDSAGCYLHARHARPVVRAFVRAEHPAQKADIFRLAWLEAEGGVYADADDRCVGPLADFGGAGLVAWQEHFGTLGNNFLACAPGHPVIRRAAGLAVEAVLRGDEDIAWLATGPGLLTRAWAQVLAEAEDVRDALSDTLVLERWQTARMALFHQFARYKTTERHWLRATAAA